MFVSMLTHGAAIFAAQSHFNKLHATNNDNNNIGCAKDTFAKMATTYSCKH